LRRLLEGIRFNLTYELEIPQVVETAAFDYQDVVLLAMRRDAAPPAL